MQKGFIICPAQYRKLYIYCLLNGDDCISEGRDMNLHVCVVGVVLQCLDIPTWYFKHFCNYLM